jgi:hypothetical protein
MGERKMRGLRHGMLASAILGLVLGIAPISALAQEGKRVTDTFKERYPDGRAPTQPPAKSDDAQPNRRPDTQQNRGPKAAEPDRVVKVMRPRPTRTVSAKRSASRVIVAPRSYLDAGTEVLPGERKFLDYALPPLHTPMDVVTNTGGRVGWHNSPLPGPFFPGNAPW